MAPTDLSAPAVSGSRADSEQSRSPLQSGEGYLRVSHVAGVSRPTRSLATNPLKLWSPRRPGPVSWTYASTFGGGLVAGDRIDLQVDVEPDATAVLTTQASTKVYRSNRSKSCRQQLTARVDRSASLVVVPDPLVCFRGALYEQFNRVHLAEDASLVYVDWLTGGRLARGECWDFARVTTRLEIIREDRPLLLESLVLDPHDGPLDSPVRMGDYRCLAIVVVLGPSLVEEAQQILETADQSSTETGLLEAASPLAEGVLWRIMGPSTEPVGHQLQERLGFLADRLGETPWERKW